ncbi:type II restriction endonuclease [Venenivibrio stagnispumantis]|uniref:Type-2 restriction enzyme n=1 Tax=Venenivibrio stagnispumantis TaxID=407998 RepID=A0AA45WQJ7_9AQUI|nr:type II restriction endonuclease [Venenivibrio stagnispumantis]MCW4573539.1 type II restriction endonuclease [Venenivibrio stagnispumantis]SMP23620.1 type II restriction enzyme [Venenivibrio stagnispumantis]
MIKFKELGFKSFEEYKSKFFETLLTTNKTYEYFVDWDKVKNTVRKNLNEIFLLNSLSKIENEKREQYLQRLLKNYPKVVEIIPILIAERAKNGKIDIFDPELENFINFNFSYKADINKIVEFCKKTGIVKLFDEITNLYDYIFGIEVGLDTNARKNRSGDIFEKLCGKKIEKLLKGKPYKIVSQDLNFSLYSEGNKKHDFVIYKNEKPVLLIECSFYNGTGSKPIETARSYIQLYKKAKDNNVKFLWITDGLAWKSLENQLVEAMKEMEWVLNFRLLNLIERILGVDENDNSG